MAFADIPGNDKIKEILRSALRRDREQGRPVILPTLLFFGAEGAGQRETALELAKALNCETQSDDACGVCDSCRRIEGGIHPDVIDVKNLPKKKEKNEFGNGNEPETGTDAEGSEGNGEADSPSSETSDSDKKTEKFYVDQVREAIKLAYMKPMIARKRLFIIDDASKMEAPVANALLKILEEPPDFTQFILIASNAELLLPTIVSRCQGLSFGPIPFDDIAAVLRDRGFGEAETRAGARIARGNYHEARTMELEDVREERARAWELFHLVLAGSEPSEFLRIFGSTGKTSRRKSDESDREWKTMLKLFDEFSRDLLLIAETGGTAGLFNPDFEDGLRELAPAIGSERALSAVRAIDSAIASVDVHLNRRLQASVLFARMTG
ncbi:MAG: DNA polymerase III subunit [Candidatus Aminicenantales bacterium]